MHSEEYLNIYGPVITLALGVTRTCRLGCVIAAHPCCLQLKRLSAAVSFGGGRSQLLEEGSLPRELLESPHNCVIDVTAGSSQALLPSSTTEWAKSVKNIVQRFAQTSCFSLSATDCVFFFKCTHQPDAFQPDTSIQKRPPSHHRV